MTRLVMLLPGGRGVLGDLRVDLGLLAGLGEVCVKEGG